MNFEKLMYGFNHSNDAAILNLAKAWDIFVSDYAAQTLLVFVLIYIIIVLINARR